MKRVAGVDDVGLVTVVDVGEEATPDHVDVTEPDLVDVRGVPLTFGMVTLHTGRKG